jgi:hypothetical protein
MKPRLVSFFTGGTISMRMDAATGGASRNQPAGIAFFQAAADDDGQRPQQRRRTQAEASPAVHAPELVPFFVHRFQGFPSRPTQEPHDNTWQAERLPKRRRSRRTPKEAVRTR